MSNTLLINVIRKKLLTVTAITNLIGTNIWKYYLHKKLNGTAEYAIVVDVGSGPPVGNNSSLNLPIARIYCYADHDSGKYNGEDKCWQLYHEVNNIMHFQQHEKQTWNGVPILNSIKASEPVLDKDKDTEVNYIYVTYNMEVIYANYV